MIQTKKTINYFCLIFLLPLIVALNCTIRAHKPVKSEPEVTEADRAQKPLKPKLEVNETDEKVKAAEKGSLRVAPKYRLGFGDVIEVKFFNNDKFNETLTVRPDGRISMQKVGDIPVAGLTPGQLSQLITKIYARILKNPEVTVIVRNFGGQQVYILGEVNTPGAVPLQRKLTVLQTLAQAGGYKESANLRSVLLLRRDQNGNVDAKRMNLTGKSSEEILENDLYVEAFDVVYVPKTFIANVNTFVDQALAGFIQPLDVYLRAAWYYGR